MGAVNRDHALEQVKESTPAGEAWQPTQSDTDLTGDEAHASRGLLITTDDALKVKMKNGTEVTFAAGTLALGIIHPISISRVVATGTSLTNAQIWLFR